MAISITSLLDAYDNVDRNSYTTSSFSPVAAQPVYVEVVNFSAGATVPTLSDSLGQYTWTQRRTISNGARVTTLFSAPNIASPSAMTLTAAFSGVTQTGCHISVVTGSGIDDSTSDGIVQSASTTGSSTSGTVTLASFGSVNNGCLMFATVASNVAITATSPQVSITDSGGTLPSQHTMTSFYAGNNTGPNFTWTGTFSYLAIAAEIKASAASAITYSTSMMMGV